MSSPAASNPTPSRSGSTQPGAIWPRPGRGCPGHADSAPALVIKLSEANARLHLYLVGDGVSGFLTAGPDGVHRCEVPDQFGIVHARLERIMSGEYLLWPLAAEPGATVAGTVLVSEIELGPRDVANFTGLQIDPALLPPEPEQATLNLAAEPAFGRVVMPEAGVTAITVPLEGDVSADTLVSGCVGAIVPSRPDLVLSVPNPEELLVVSGTANVDTTLMVVAPDNNAYCNDDAANFDPTVEIEDAAPGDYAIWVGAFGATPGEQEVLSFGRHAPAASEVTGTGSDPVTTRGADQRAAFEKALDAHRRICGGAPAGYRAPVYNVTQQVIDLMIEHGLRYDSSLMADDIPYRMETAVGGLYEMPVHWGTDDWPPFAHYDEIGYMMPVRAPSDGMRGFWEEFEAQYEAGGFFMLIVHPFLTGRLARWRQVEKWLETTLATRDVWFTTLAGIVDHLDALVAAGTYAPRVERLPYYAGSQE